MRYIITIISLATFVGCGPRVDFESNVSVGDSWSYDKVMTYDVDIVDTSQYYNLEFVLDHAIDFTYQNLYVLISTTYPNEKVVEDELSLQLANKVGEWSGKCGSDKCNLTIVLQEKFRFQALGIHKIAIAQHSRIDDLSGIYGGTLRLVHYENKK